MSGQPEVQFGSCAQEREEVDEAEWGGAPWTTLWGLLILRGIGSQEVWKLA